MSTITKPAFTTDPMDDDKATFGPSGYVELSKHEHPDGGASQLELLLIERDAAVTLAISKDNGANLELTKAEWEEFKLHGDDAWGGVRD